MNSPVLWANPSAKSFFVWGGWLYSLADNFPQATDVWQYTLVEGLNDAAGRIYDSLPGEGEWSRHTAGIGDLTTLSRPFGCASAVLNGKGYCLGGAVMNKEAVNSTEYSSATRNEFRGSYAVSGMVSFDMATMTFANDSSTGFGKYGNVINGRAEAIPYGPEGVIIFLGGRERPAGAYGGGNLMDFNTVYLYEPKGK